MILKKEKQIYFALESTPASLMTSIKASSKRLSIKKRGRVGGEREERENVCMRVWMCVRGCVYTCIFMFVCVYEGVLAWTSQ